MHRFPIPSKEITQVGYQEDSETLEIQFVKGGVYQFFNVPSTVFDEFMSAPSKEGYYHSKKGERFARSKLAQLNIPPRELDLPLGWIERSLKGELGAHFPA